MADEDVSPVVEPPSPRTAPVVRAGLLALMLLGVVSALLSLPSLVSTDSVRCSIAEQMVEDANDDDDDWNDVDIGEGDVEDLSCPDTIAAAERILVREDGDDYEKVPSDGAILFRGITALIVGIGQAATGLATLRSGRREIRNVALTFAALGLIFAVLGIISLVILTFAFYAIGFSAAAQAIWPRKRGSLGAFGGGALGGFGRRPMGRSGSTDAAPGDEVPGDETPPGTGRDEPEG
jgi:hypothetical protein